jgi:hypothetical protein
MAEQPSCPSCSQPFHDGEVVRLKRGSSAVYHHLMPQFTGTRVKMDCVDRAIATGGPASHFGQQAVFYGGKIYRMEDVARLSDQVGLDLVFIKSETGHQLQGNLKGLLEYASLAV